jgi:hypothetical protein
MKHLKYFESTSEPTLKEKLESIVDMAYYLFDNDMKGDLNNFIGNCSVLFTGCVDIKGGFWSAKYPKRFYRFDIDCFINKLDDAHRKEEKLSQVEELYKLSLIKRHQHTIKDVEKLIKPLINMESYGEDIIEDYEIKPYFNGWKKKPCFSIKLLFKPDIYYIDKHQVEELWNTIQGSWRQEEIKYAKEEIKEVEKEFYYLLNELKDELKKMNLNNLGFSNFETSEYTHLGKFFYINVLLEES